MPDSATLVGNSRPWGGQATGDCGPYTERQWHYIYRTIFDGSGDRGPLLDAAGTQLQVTERGAGANMSVDIAPGTAVIDGLWADNPAIVNLTVAASDAVQDRYDLVFAYWDSATQLTQLRIVDGVLGAGSCEAVANYQTANVEWAIPLACVYVAATVVTIANADITDLREFCRYRFDPVDLVDGTHITTDANHLLTIAADGVGVDEINAAIAGLGLVQAVGGELDVNPDGVTLEINADAVRIAAGAAGNGLVGGGGAALAVNVDAATIVIVGDTLLVGEIDHTNIVDRARDDYVGAGAMYPASAAAVAWGTIGALAAPTEGWLLPTALDRYVVGHWETWTGTVAGNISVTIVWTHVSAGAQLVTWDFTYCTNMSCGDSLVATTNITEDFAAAAADAIKRICSTLATVIAVNENDFIDFHVGRRFSSGTDTYAGSAVLLGVVFDFTADM